MVQLTAPSTPNNLGNNVGTPNTNQNIVGQFIRAERERKSLSQKALGQMFTPPVTTQFISNIERGVTPLPPVHIQTLTKIFELNEEVFMDVFEREYMTKLSQQLGRTGAYTGVSSSASAPSPFSGPHADLLKKFVETFQSADPQSQEQMKRTIESFVSNAASLR